MVKPTQVDIDKWLHDKEKLITAADKLTWNGFLDALGRIEGQDKYGIAQKGWTYRGIYQFGSDAASTGAFFGKGLGNGFLGVDNMLPLQLNPIAQELLAIMMFSGIPKDFGSFSSRYRQTQRNTLQGKEEKTIQKMFDKLVDSHQEFTIKYYGQDAQGTLVYTDEKVTFTKSGISAAAHLLGGGSIANAMVNIYNQCYNSNGTRKTVKDKYGNDTYVTEASLPFGLIKNTNYRTADSSNVPFTTYMHLFGGCNVNELISATGGLPEFLELAKTRIEHRKVQILDFLTKGCTYIVELETTEVDAYKGSLPKELKTGRAIPIKGKPNLVNQEIIVPPQNETMHLSETFYDLAKSIYETLGMPQGYFPSGKGGTVVLVGAQKNDDKSFTDKADLIISLHPKIDYKMKDGKYVTDKDGHNIPIINALSSGGGNDTLVGGIGYDALNGGTGEDTYIFKPGGAKDTISDPDDNNKIFIGDFHLEGADAVKCKCNNKGKKEWNVNDGQYIYTLDETKDLSKLTIWGYGLGGGSITLSGIGNVQDAKKRFGISLNDTNLCCFVDNIPDQFTSADNVTVSSDERGGRDTFLALKNPLKVGDIIRIVASAIDIGLSYLKLVTGSEVLDFSTGSVTLTPTEGQTLIPLAFLAEQDISGDATVTFQAFVTSTDENGVTTTTEGNTFTLNVKDMNGQPGSTQTITLRDGDDSFKTEAGVSMVHYGGDPDTLWSVVGDDGPAHAFGYAGSDYLSAGAGNDILEGGDGVDALLGGAGNDILYGGAAGAVQECINQGETQTGTGQRGDWVDAGDGNDQIFTGAGNDVLAGGAGDDLLVSGGGDDLILSDWNIWSDPNGWREWAVTVKTMDSFHVHGIGFSSEGVGNDVIYAGAGDDIVLGGGGDDAIYLGAGNDWARGGAGKDVILGGDGDDIIHGDAIPNLLNGTLITLDESLHGDDFIDGGACNDYLRAWDGNDTLVGGAGNDILYGRAA